MSLADHEKIKNFQENKCAICGHPPKNRAHGVDHCHKTGLIRGLLCPHCNVALGKFRDSTEMVRKALNYLEQPPASKALGEQRFGIKGRVSNKRKTIRRLNPDRF